MKKTLWQKYKKIVFRVLTDLAIFISIFVFPWWLTLIVAMILVFYFRFYLEFIFFALFIDLVYGHNIHFFEGLMTVSAVILSLLFQVARKRMIFYSE